MKKVADCYGHRFAFSEQLIGGAAIDAVGDPFPPASKAACLDSDAILLGAVGGPQWSDPKASIRPEQGLLGLRTALGVFANLRPVQIHPDLIGASPIKADRLTGVDMIVVRELTGGIYFGEKTRTKVGAVDGINIKLAKCASLREALRMVGTARAHGLRVMMGCMVESSLGIAAASHLAPLLDYADLDGAALLANDPFTGPSISGGTIAIPTTPGLGVSRA